jgi:hypothetical protein
MKTNLASVVLLLWAVAGQAGEKDIIQRLEQSQIHTVTADLFGEKDVLVVLFDAPSAHTDVSELCEMRRLRSVMLAHRRVTEADMRPIGDLTGLRILVLSQSTVTDAHLKHVKRLRQLKWLALIDTPITDAGLKELAEMKHLEQLWIEGTGVTEEGVDRLRKALPRCVIVFDKP